MGIGAVPRKKWSGDDVRLGGSFSHLVIASLVLTAFDLVLVRLVLGLPGGAHLTH